MPPKTSARTRKASSPPPSPNNARTRVTRSQSAEVSNARASNTRVNTRARQGSFENAIANTGRPQSRDLAAVAEDDGEYDLRALGSPSLSDAHEELSSPGSSQVASPPQELSQGFDQQLVEAQVIEENNNLRYVDDGLSRYPDAFEQLRGMSAEEEEAESGRVAQSSSRAIASMEDQDPDATINGVMKTWTQDQNERNKENRRPKRRLIDPHPEATRETWDSQDYIQQSSAVNAQNAPPPGQGDEELDEPVSEDEGFQQDPRQYDNSRRIQNAPAEHPAKRVRREEPIPSSARHADIVDNLPVEQIVQTQAKVITQHMGLQQRKIQVRRPWSKHDEELLIRFIAEFGCSWSYISKLEGWDVIRDNMQVDLKDKARNLKVAFLKAGTELPINFYGVRLGKKEIAAVQKVRPEYDQEAELREALAQEA